MQESPFASGDAAHANTLSLLGLDPAHPLYDLNLAGVQGVPSPQMLAQPSSTPEILLPDFGMQNYEIPTVKPYDLTAPALRICRSSRLTLHCRTLMPIHIRMG